MRPALADVRALRAENAALKAVLVHVYLRENDRDVFDRLERALDPEKKTAP